MRTRSTLICSVSALFCASSSTSSSFRLSFSSESSVSGGIPNLNQPPVMRSMPKTRVKPTQRGEQLPINSFTLSQHIPNAQLVLYPDSGHGALFQYPELFVAHTKVFLDA